MNTVLLGLLYRSDTGASGAMLDVICARYENLYRSGAGAHSILHAVLNAILARGMRSYIASDAGSYST